MVAGDDLEEGHGLGHQPQLLVQLGQLEVDFGQLGVELEHLLVEGDRLQEEPVLGIDLGDLGEEGGGLRVLSLLLVQLAHLLEHAHVARIHVEHLLVLADGLVEGTFGDELGGALDDLGLVHRRQSRSRGSPSGTAGSTGFPDGHGNVTAPGPSRNVPDCFPESPRG